MSKRSNRRWRDVAKAFQQLVKSGKKGTKPGSPEELRVTNFLFEMLEYLHMDMKHFVRFVNKPEVMTPERIGNFFEWLHLEEPEANVVAERSMVLRLTRLTNAEISAYTRPKEAPDAPKVRESGENEELTNVGSKASSSKAIAAKIQQSTQIQLPTAPVLSSESSDEELIDSESPAPILIPTFGTNLGKTKGRNTAKDTEWKPEKRVEKKRNVIIYTSSKSRNSENNDDLPLPLPKSNANAQENSNDLPVGDETREKSREEQILELFGAGGISSDSEDEDPSLSNAPVQVPYNVRFLMGGGSSESESTDEELVEEHPVVRKATKVPDEWLIGGRQSTCSSSEDELETQAEIQQKSKCKAVAVRKERKQKVSAKVKVLQAQGAKVYVQSPYDGSENKKKRSRKPRLSVKNLTPAELAAKKPFTCSKPNCDRRFVSKRNATKHSNTCGSKGIYRCSECPNVYSSILGLKGHGKAHTGGWPCKFCKQVFWAAQTHSKHQKKCGFVCVKCGVKFLKKKAFKIHSQECKK